MIASIAMTAEQYIASREDLPEGGRWTELVNGAIVSLTPPTIEHGTAVLNLGKSLAEYTQREPRGYACFELGLVVARGPDTVRFPAVSYFVNGPLFAETDKIATETRPGLVVEIPSTGDRRRGIDNRVSAWLEWGVPLVWILDPQSKRVHVIQAGRSEIQRAEDEMLEGGAVLSGFSVAVCALFKEPKWAR